MPWGAMLHTCESKKVYANMSDSLRPTPSSIVLFITGRCNAHCRHCFYSSQLNRNDDAIDESNLSILLDSLTGPTNISLTGGEPFVRSDFDDMLNLVLSSSRIQSVSINSNGMFTERIQSVVCKALTVHRKPLHIQLSLDGGETTHDAIRRAPGGFRKTVTTAEWLQDYAQRNSFLSSTLSATVMRSNLAEIEMLIAFLQDRKLRCKISFVRGNSFSTFHVPKSLLNKEYESSESPAEVHELEALLGRIQINFPLFFNDYSLRKLENAIAVLKNCSRQLPCYAGDRDGVVYHDGLVGICEQVIPFGHLSSWAWNLNNAWNSKAAQEQRRLLRRCACIHGCNVSTSVAAVLDRVTQN